jgi:hypothetical protein
MHSSSPRSCYMPCPFHPPWLVRCYQYEIFASLKLEWSNW